MRQLSAAPQRGLTLIELMVTITIGGILMMAGAPYLGDYIQNSRLREAGNSALSAALFAQSEAIKRNGRVRMSIEGSKVEITDRVGLASDAAGTALRTLTLPDGVKTTSNASVDFGSEGRTWPLGTTLTFGFAKSGITCSTEIRCPALVIEAGGAVRLCVDKTHCS
ncbi:GspH/FimT family pseudopilin [Aquincola sp. MAHUQ-54]|uniref:Type II secretion system protein H n=1 Tax=Aquincola agrisoli TaxID=3119538 RepID=A0AAW9QK79_9BURK